MESQTESTRKRPRRLPSAKRTDVAGHGDFRSFYEVEYPLQVRRAGLLLRSAETAADVVQDSFIAVWDRWSDLSDPGPYLNRCVVNGCRSADRRSNAGHRAVGKLGPLLEDVAEGDLLWDAIGALDFNHRAPIVLRYYGQLSNREIASALEWPEGSVGPRLTSALRTLRKALQ